MPTVSIVVPVYNVEKSLERCVTSLLKQTLSDIEVVLVDDGSTDSSGRLCDEFAEKDSRVTVIHQNNQGVSVARNTGIKVSKGTWLTFVDSDDWADEKLCEVAVDAGIRESADIIFFSYWTVYADATLPSMLLDLNQGDITKKKDYIQKKIISQYYGGNVRNNGVSAGTTWGKLIRRKVIDEGNVAFVPGLTRAQDTVFWLKAIECAEKITLIDDSLYYYRVTDSSVTSGTKYLPNCETPFLRLLDEYNSFIVAYNKDDSYKEALYVRSIQVLSWFGRHKYFHASYPRKRIKSILDYKSIVNIEPFKTALSRVNYGWLPPSLKMLVMCCRLHLLPIYYCFTKAQIAFHTREKLHSMMGK